MKFLKRLLIFIVALVAIVLIVALIAPRNFDTEKEIVINKPKQEVFDYLKYIKNQDNFGVWQMMDPDAKKNFIGEDGTVGFTYEWDGKKIGKGRQVIAAIDEGNKLETDLYFMESKEAAKSYFILTEKSPNETSVKWGITGKTPYPFNIINLFMDMGKDFEDGLQNLKNVVESQESPIINETPISDTLINETQTQNQN